MLNEVALTLELRMDVVVPDVAPESYFFDDLAAKPGFALRLLHQQAWLRRRFRVGSSPIAGSVPR